MEFLTRDQCLEFARRVGVTPRKQDVDLPETKKKHDAVFYEDSLNPIAQRCVEIVVELFPTYKHALLWISGSPGVEGWGEKDSYMRERESWKRFVDLRRSHGEERRLYDAPGHLLMPEERPLIAELAEPAILHGWDSLLLAKPNVTAVYFSHNDDIRVISDKNITRWSDAFTGLGLTKGSW